MKSVIKFFKQINRIFMKQNIWTKTAISMGIILTRHGCRLNLFTLEILSIYCSDLEDLRRRLIVFLTKGLHV